MILKINFKKMNENFLWLVTLFMFLSFYIFVTYSWGRYVLAITAIIVLIFGIIFNNTKLLKLKINYFHIIQFIFATYCLFSCLWSIDATTSLSRTFTMFQILLFFSVFMAYFCEFNSIDSLLSVIMYAGYIVSIYFITYFGGLFTTLQIVLAGKRFANEFANVNEIGILCSFACIIQYQKIITNKKWASSILVVPTLLVLLACQSRKSLIFLVLGIILVTIFKNLTPKSAVLSILKIFVASIIIYTLFNFLFSLEIFASFFKRFELLFALFTPEGKIDSSTELRRQFLIIGYDYFSKNPLFGKGVASSSLILSRELNVATYFHSNYIELLATTGILGTIIYYCNYIYLLYQLFKYRKCDINNTCFCITILILLLTMDIAMVSYYSKCQYFYLMICYIQLEILKRKRRTSNERQYVN